MLEREGTGIYPTEMIEEVAVTLGGFGHPASEELAACFEPPSLDERIVN